MRVTHAAVASVLARSLMVGDKRKDTDPSVQ